MKILITDDMADNLDMLEIVLKSRNHRVVRAMNGKEALNLLENHTPELIISDILMPVMDGFQLCRVCKQDERWRHIPFIFYTATYIDKKDRDFALSLGADMFLVKPLEPSQILKIVDDFAFERQAGEPAQPTVKIDEKEVYKLYSERLVNKLEKKMQELEKEIIRRKQTEAALIKAKEKAEQADRLKSAFLANISHEIRTPLNGIIGFASLFHESELSRAKIKSYSEIIIRSGQRLTNIIADIIEVSKLESNQVGLQPEAIRLSSLLKSIHEEMSIGIATNKRLKLLVNCHIPENLVTLTDRTKLAQVLINLIANAIKYTPEGEVEIGCRISHESGILFYVRDTGIGIDPANHELIFERFRQVQDTLHVFQSGTGLGLAISKAYIEMMGGRIWLKSSPGEGSTFSFSIPYTPAKLPDHSEESTRHEGMINLEGRQILVAEDDNMNYRYIEESLIRQNARVIRAVNGKEAMDQIHLNPDLDMVLMDMRMPVMNGFEATRLISQIKPKVPIIAQTAYAYSDDKERAIQAGCLDFITKPYTARELLDIVAKHIG